MIIVSNYIIYFTGPPGPVGLGLPGSPGREGNLIVNLLCILLSN